LNFENFNTNNYKIILKNNKQKLTVLVTGGAGGIGSAICKKFAETGYSVIITYNSDAEKANKLLAELNKIQNLKSETQNHAIFQAPNTNPKKLKELTDFVEEKYGKLDVLVNNAGITTQVKHNDLDSLTDEWIDKILQTNVKGTFAMIRAMKNLLTPNPFDEELSLVKKDKNTPPPGRAVKFLIFCNFDEIKFCLWT
jgi:3-oxoacyl-[acyl-carrier protein] reductase